MRAFHTQLQASHQNHISRNDAWLRRVEFRGGADAAGAGAAARFLLSRNFDLQAVDKGTCQDCIWLAPLVTSRPLAKLVLDSDQPKQTSPGTTMAASVPALHALSSRPVSWPSLACSPIQAGRRTVLQRGRPSHVGDFAHLFALRLALSISALV